MNRIENSFKAGIMETEGCYGESRFVWIAMMNIYINISKHGLEAGFWFPKFSFAVLAKGLRSAINETLKHLRHDFANICQGAMEFFWKSTM